MICIKTMRCFCATLVLAAVMPSISPTHAQTSTWRPLTDPRTNNAVWMASATVGWAVGVSGSISQTTNGGTSWTPQTSGVTVDLHGIWGTSAPSVWAVGEGGNVLFWDGTYWTPQTTGVTTKVNAISGFNSTTVTADVDPDEITKCNPSPGQT